MLYFKILSSIFDSNVFRISRKAYWFMVLVELAIYIMIIVSFLVWANYIGYFKILSSIFDSNVFRISRKAYWFMVLVELAIYIMIIVSFLVWANYIGTYTLAAKLKNYIGFIQFCAMLLGLLYGFMSMVRGAMRIRDVGFSVKYYYIGYLVVISLAFIDLIVEFNQEVANGFMSMVRGAMRIRDVGFSVKYYYIGYLVVISLAFIDLIVEFNQEVATLLGLIILGFNIVVFIFTLMPTDKDAERFGTLPTFEGGFTKGAITTGIALCLIFCVIIAKPMYAKMTHITGCQIEENGRTKNLGVLRYDYKYFGELAEGEDIIWDFHVCKNDTYYWLSNRGKWQDKKSWGAKI